MIKLTRHSTYVLLLAGLWTNAFSQDADCRYASDAYACLDKLLATAETQLEKAYEDALAGMPETSPTDIRKGKNQLIAAQNAWREFTRKDCDYVGGLLGGNNHWVSFFSTQCTLKRTQQRLEFFTQIKSGNWSSSQ